MVLTGAGISSFTMTGGTVALHVPGLSLVATGVTVSTTGGILKVAVAGATLTAGGLSLHAGLTFTSGTDASGARTMSIAVSNTYTGSGSGTAFLVIPGAVTVNGAAGNLTSSAAGTSGSLTLDDVHFDADLPVSANAANIALRFGGGDVAISVTDASVLLAGYTFRGSFALDRNGTATRFAFTGIEVFTGAISIGEVPLITGVEGGFVVTASGVAGFLTGTLTAATEGVEIGGTAVVRVNSTGGAVNESIEVGGRAVAIVFNAGSPTWEISISGLTIEIGDFVTLEGNLTWQRGVTLSCGTGCTHTGDVVAGQGLRIFIGQGPAFLGTGGINPLATGVLLTDATVGLVKYGNEYALSASGTVSLVGIDGVTLAGTAAVRVNTTGLALNQGIAIGGSTAPPVAVVFANGGPTRSFSLTGVTIGVLGQTLTGDLAIEKTADGLVLAVQNLSLDLGGAATLTHGSGVLVLTAAGLGGRSPAPWT